MEEDRKAILKAVFALSTLFSDCVETFGLIHPQHNWEKNEQILLVKLGIQQARLLVWGGILGVCSPPAFIATHMIPSHPSANNPEPENAIFFGERDARLDDVDIREKVHAALSEIIDQAGHMSRKDMMSRYGLKPSKKGHEFMAPILDPHRLEGFREKFLLLQDLVEAHGMLASKKRSAVAHSWTISDVRLFEEFIDLIRSKVDYLVQKMGLAEKVNRAVKVDIRALGWHPSVETAASARNVSKLMIVNEACVYDYPDYASAAQQALDNINDRWKGSDGYCTLAAPDPVLTVRPRIPEPAPAAKAQRPGILKLFRGKSWKKPKEEKRPAASTTCETPRSKSETDTTDLPTVVWTSHNPEPMMERVRSKSVSDVPIHDIKSRMSQEIPLSLVKTVADDRDADLTPAKTLTSMISRHDQWRDPYS